MNIFRRYIYNNAERIIFREDISQDYYKELKCKESIVTCDLALRNEINIERQEEKLNVDYSLVKFFNKYEKIVGITITDLRWHPKFSGDIEVINRITSSFTELIEVLEKKGYGVMFIPQQFGMASDCQYMQGFSRDNCFMLNNDYDCYLQQFVIGRLFAVVGMRYHSNIFSAKMGTPFISVSYEQKMKGFVKKIDYSDYCIDIEALSSQELIGKFLRLEKHYDELKMLLETKVIELKKLSNITTEIIIDYLKGND